MTRRTPIVAEVAPAGEAACWRVGSAGLCVLVLQVQPNARQTEVLGIQDGALKLKLAAPPVDGQANEALVAWLAKSIGCAKRDVRVRRGTAARHKQVEVGVDGPRLQAWVERVVPR
jgi:uncharacterized protein